MPESKTKSTKKKTKGCFVHPRGLVDEGAVVGDGTRVWAFAHVMKGAVVGADCNICDSVFVEAGAVIGDKVTIKNGVQVWDGVTVEDGVFLGPNCTLTNHLDPRAFLKRPSSEWLKRTKLGEGCTIGANATVVCGVTVGCYAFAAAGAVVTKDVAAHALVMGNPARQKGWICRCAARLVFKGARARCAGCGDEYLLAADKRSIARTG